MPMNVVVTGSNTGLGLELCKQLHARGDNVYATCRNSSPELEAVGVAKIITNIDVTSADAADALVSALKDVSTIDALINNGGGRYSTYDRRREERGWSGAPGAPYSTTVGLAGDYKNCTK